STRRWRCCAPTVSPPCHPSGAPAAPPSSGTAGRDGWSWARRTTTGWSSGRSQVTPTWTATRSAAPPGVVRDGPPVHADRRLRRSRHRLAAARGVPRRRPGDVLPATPGRQPGAADAPYPRAVRPVPRARTVPAIRTRRRGRRPAGEPPRHLRRHHTPPAVGDVAVQHRTVSAPAAPAGRAAHTGTDTGAAAD